MFLVRTEVVSVGVGLVLGGLGGLVIARSRKREWMSDIWAQLATLAVALVCFQVGEGLHGSGFVAAFAGGLAFAFVAKRVGRAAGDAGVRRGRSAARADGVRDVRELRRHCGLARRRLAGGPVRGLALFAVRLVAVAWPCSAAACPFRNRLFIGWFGPRGIGTLVLGLLVVERGQIEQESLIIQVVAVTVTLSLVVHSLTAWPGIRWLVTTPAEQT